MAEVAAELRKNYVDDSDLSSQSDGYDASSESNDEHSQVRSVRLNEGKKKADDLHFEYASLSSIVSRKTLKFEFCMVFW